MPNKLSLGLILDPEFYLLKKSVTAITLPFIDALIDKFNTKIIYNQERYDKVCEEVDLLLSFEPNWSAPMIKWNRSGRFKKSMPKCPTLVKMSDPHEKRGREKYFLKQNIDFLLAQYLNPTLLHFDKVPHNKIVHFPWAIPDNWFNDLGSIKHNGDKEIMIFGGAQSDAYNFRNWCRLQPGVKSYSNSGVEGKVVDDNKYGQWLAQFDAIIAAGSDAIKYRLTTPKYFEVAAVGSLLFAQETDDLETLGFKDMENCIIFSQKNFNALAQIYLSSKADSKWLKIRRAGKDLVFEKHKISNRLDELEKIVFNWKGR